MGPGYYDTLFKGKERNFAIVENLQIDLKFKQGNQNTVIVEVKNEKLDHFSSGYAYVPVY